jgi:hypothetical protein
MITIVGFSFLYHRLQIYVVCHVHYTSFTCDKGLWNSRTLKHASNF